MYNHIVYFMLLASMAVAAPVPQSPDDIRPLLVGSSVPQLTLNNPAGEEVQLDTLVTSQKTVLIFYRGGWCPYCTRQLSGLQEIEQDLRDLGFQIVAVSADRPEKLKETVIQKQLGYTLLSDNDMKAATAFGIAFQLPEETIRKYKEEYKIDVEADSGRKHHQLPVPAVFLIGDDDKIAFAHVNPDYRSRLDPQIILSAAKALAE